MVLGLDAVLLMNGTSFGTMVLGLDAVVYCQSKKKAKYYMCVLGLVFFFFNFITSLIQNTSIL